MAFTVCLQFGLVECVRVKVFDKCYTGSREQAFAYALASASLTQSVSKACSAGTTMRCSCGGVPREPANPIASSDRPDEQFQWGGCSDDVKFGLEFSQAFVEAAATGAGRPPKSAGTKMKNKASKKTLMNHHNYHVGRKVPNYYIVVLDFRRFL